jgi:hypothetical protein
MPLLLLDCVPADANNVAVMSTSPCGEWQWFKEWEIAMRTVQTSGKKYALRIDSE